MMDKKCLCDLKDREEKLITQGSWVNLYITKEHDEYWINAVGDGIAAMRIKYCPECGRKLEEDEPEDDWEL